MKKRIVKAGKYKRSLVLSKKFKKEPKLNIIQPAKKQLS